MRSRISAIVLAAGAGSRFGGGKLLASYQGRPLVETVLSQLHEAPVNEIIAVVGDQTGEGGVRLRQVCSLYGALIAENPRWEEGISTSVKRGLAACSPDTDAAVVVLGDQPLVGATAVRRLLEAHEGGASVAVATYGGKRRNPVLFAHGTWPMLREELSGDEGARGFLERHPEMVTEVACDDVADPADVDTREDLRRLEARGPGEPAKPEGGQTMKLENEFTVDTSIDEAWKALNDLERVTPCLPGAQLTAEVGDEYEGTMTVKMGPVTQKYNGTVKIEETDESAHRAVIRADGKDARGQGTASATITSTLSEQNGGVHVLVETDMQLTGRVAQFGRGMHKEVASKIMGRFAECLEKEL